MSKIKVGDKIRIKRGDTNNFFKGAICEVVDVSGPSDWIEAKGESEDYDGAILQFLSPVDYELVIEEPLKSKYIACANRIIEDLKGRRGFYEAFDLDDDILEDIVEEMAGNIEKYTGGTND